VTERDVLHYRITGELGQGAMGEVFRAIDQRLGREVALKMLPADVAGDPGWETRMLREAQAASALNHPGIVTLHGIESANGRTFLVMELVVGDRFVDLARSGIPWRRAVELVIGVAEALAVAHSQGILHRDIKSDNLMVIASGQIKVLDFGLAKLRTQPDPGGAPIKPSETLQLKAAAQRALSSDLTQAGQLVGTPAYMAPECYEGQADVRSEVFALGVVLYELLAGARPFDRGDAIATMAAIQLDDPGPPSRAAPERGIPERVDAIVARAIAKLPEERFQDMPAMVAALREAIRPRARRWPWLVAVPCALGLGAAAWFAFGHRDRDLSIELTDSRRLTMDPGCEEYPQLHPDGRRVVYDGLIGDDYEILMRDIDGNTRRNLSATPGWDYAAALSPDGKLVAYVHEDTAGRVVRVLHVDGDPAPREVGATVGYPAWSGNSALLLGDAAGRIVRREVEGGRETLLGQLPAGARPYHLTEVADAGG
jgi:serine/threonine protein kinase